MGSERTHVDKYLCTVCGHRHSNGWYCKHSIDAKDAEIERLKAELGKRCIAHGKMSATIVALEAQLAAMGQQAGNVLARIHGDGGHYITQHGWEKACVDADAVVCRLQAQLAASEEKVEALLPHGNRRRVELLNERLSLGSLSEAHQKELDSLQSLFGEIHGKRLAAGNDALRNALEAP